jgi:hypothetical protein
VLQELPSVDFLWVEPVASWSVVCSVGGPSSTDIMTEPSLTGGATAAAEGGAMSAGGPAVSEPFVVAYPVEF